MSAGPRRVLMLTPGVTGRDGLSTLSRLTARALAGSSTELDVVALHDGPADESRDELPACRVVGAGGRKRAWVVAALKAAWTGAAASHVLCMHLHLAPVARLVTALGRGTSSLSVFLIGIEAWKRLGVGRAWGLGGADRLVAISAHTARRFREANPRLDRARLHVCQPGVPTAAGASSHDAALDEAGRPFALVVGRMAAAERYKGHDLLLDIWPRVMDEIPDARLVVAGGGDDRARLETRARPLGDRVRFYGDVSDDALGDLYRRAGFFVMPSRHEGFGLVFLEAMRAGKACIGAVGAAAEVIEDGVTGLIVDPAEPEDVLKAVLRLFREDATRGRMGKAGALRVANEFTLGHYARRLRHVLDSPDGAS